MMVDRVNQRFGDYQLVRYLGKGGFGEVYLGQHVYDKSQAAIKLLKTSLRNETDHKEFVSKLKEFINEASTFNPDHPNIVKLLAFGMGKDDAPFLAFAYAPNGSLRDCHQRGESVPLQIVLTYVKQIAAGLQYAHDHRRIHRDVKPENMLLGANNEVLISDFGIATFAHSTESWEEQKQTGTPYYMAPEQIMRQAQPSSDQYSLAVVVYEWLCGSLPFEGDQFSPREIQQVQLMNQHLKDEPPSLHKRNPNISSAVEQVLMKALAKKPQDRFDNIMAFATDLERAASGKAAPLIKQADFPQPPIRPVTPQPSAVPVTLRSPVGNQPDILSQISPDPLEQLFQEGVRAQSSGNTEKAFHIWRQIMMMPGDSSQIRATAHNRLQEPELRTQMIPLILKQAREASMQGRWQDEMRLWEDLLALEPQQQDLAPLLKTPLTLDKHYYNFQDVYLRYSISKQNAQFEWMYTGVQQHIQNNDSDAARTQLQMLWKDAPYYGDPGGFAQILGLSAAMNYEQALAAEPARLKKERIEQEQQERIEQLKRMEEIAKQRRSITISLILIVLVGITGLIIGGMEETSDALGAGTGAGLLIAGCVAGAIAGVGIGVSKKEQIKGGMVGGAIVIGLALIGIPVVEAVRGSEVADRIAFGIFYGIISPVLYWIIYWISGGIRVSVAKIFGKSY